MRYSVRQQYCLQTMGIVPWVSRFPENTAALATATEYAEAVDAVESTGAIAEVIETAEPAVATGTPASPEVGSEQPPHAADSLGEWLLEQALVPIEFRGGLHPVLGVADAPLLVVLALKQPSPTAGSMAGDDGRLFELMLRSISLSNRDTRRCQLGHRAIQSTVIGTDTVSQAGLSALCAANTRGVLVLTDPWPFDVQDTAVEAHQSRLPESGLPVWRIPHPTILLEQPQLKRQAWHVLKHLRAVLDGAAQ